MGPASPAHTEHAPSQGVIGTCSVVEATASRRRKGGAGLSLTPAILNNQIKPLPLGRSETAGKDS